MCFPPECEGGPESVSDTGSLWLLCREEREAGQGLGEASEATRGQNVSKTLILDASLISPESRPCNEGLFRPLDQRLWHTLITPPEEGPCAPASGSAVGRWPPAVPGKRQGQSGGRGNGGRKSGQEPLGWFLREEIGEESKQL